MKTFAIVIIIFLPIFLFCQTAGESDFSNPLKYGWNTPEKLFSYRQDLQKRQDMLQIYEMKKQNVVTNLVKSSVIPGWGQYAAHRFTKGQIVLVAEVSILVGSYLSYLDAMDNFDKYKKANYIGDINKYYKKAQDQYEQSQYLLGAGLVLWLFNIYDSVISTEAYNNDTWRTLYEDESKSISLEINGISLNF